MSDMWKMAARRSSEFDSSAVAYDRYRPQYPRGIFEDIVELGELRPGAKAREIGAGTGIGTASLVDVGLQVVAIEPSAGMRKLGEEKLGDAAQFVEGRFEDWVAAAKETRGSWWVDWIAWITAQAPERAPAREVGAGKLKPISRPNILGAFTKS